MLPVANKMMALGTVGRQLHLLEVRQQLRRKSHLLHRIKLWQCNPPTGLQFSLHIGTGAPMP